jgi:hypothetical protein
MANGSDNRLNWIATAGGLGVCVFLSAFALDAVGTGKSWSRQAAELLMHLIPVFLLAVIVLASWRREWLGAIVFGGLAVWYAWISQPHMSWMLTISGPLLAVSLLFFLSWRRRRHVHAV